jgi:hypothetical protein
MRPVDEATAVLLSEAEYAAACRARGARVVERHGRHWEEIRPGFFTAVHWLARMSAAEARPPSNWSWGYQTTMNEEGAASSNASLPAHLLRDVVEYDVDRLSKKRRYDLRKSQRLVTIVELTSPALLEAEGYEVMRSAYSRTTYKDIPTPEAFRASLVRSFWRGRLVLAGLIDGRLGGYLEGHVVQGSAYVGVVHIATEALPTQIGTALIFNFVQICKQSRGVHEIMYGLHVPEDPALTFFKEGMGFPVVRLPSLVHINPLVGALIHCCRPNTYYRLTGRERSISSLPSPARV